MPKVLNLIECSKSQMNSVKAGCVWDPTGCHCACAYSDSGGSSPYTNWEANHSQAIWRPYLF